MRRTEVIEQIKDIIRHVAPTAKTILYGSQARNEARSDSDIDLLILLDGEKITLKEEEAITLPLYELELKTGISISPKEKCFIPDRKLLLKIVRRHL